MNMKEAEQKKKRMTITSFSFLYIDDDEIVDPYFERLDRKRLNKVFADDEVAKDDLLSQRQDREYHETLWDMYRTRPSEIS